MQRVPATDTFEISWPDPEMAQAPWVGDRMHFPGPTAPLAQRFVGNFMEQILSAPTIFANGYEFSLPPTIPDPSPEVVAGGLDVWHDEYAPRIRAFCERIRATDFDAMSIEELAGALDGLAADALDHARLTMVVIKRFMEPTFALLEFLERELGADGPILSGTLLQGFQNATTASGSGLDGLVAQAAGSPELASALPGAGTAGLAELPGGAAFLEAFDSYLDDFGWRVETWGSMHVPTWAEQPEAALTLIGRYLSSPRQRPGGEAEPTDGRNAALASVESRLSGEKLQEFRRLLEATLQHVAVSEDRARWQLSIIGVMRLPLLALGRKLVERGALDEAADVFYVDWEDAKRAATSSGDSLREAARAGKADFARWQQLAPPPFLGVPPDPAAMPAETLPMVRHFFGLGPPAVDAGVISGVGASRGTVTGRARVIRQLDESDRLETGDVMVCVTTAPPWTALFAIAGAVVTDTGGVMSHSAICAREFSIPCVVGTQVGTRMIPDGAMITVDGEAGTVTILPS